MLIVQLCDNIYVDNSMVADDQRRQCILHNYIHMWTIFAKKLSLNHTKIMKYVNVLNVVI